MKRHDIIPSELVECDYEFDHYRRRRDRYDYDSYPSSYSGGPSWHATGVYRGAGGTRVETGTMGAMTHVIDPATTRPLTPGFHEIVHMDEDRLIARTGGSTYHLYEPEKDTTGASRKSRLPEKDPRPGSARYPEYIRDVDL